MNEVVSTWRLRAAFAQRLSELYAQEVPAYSTLVDVSRAVNQDAVARQGANAERLGTLDRVTAERHGAIRVGTPRELAQVATIFGALGMQPVGFYDLRDAHPSPIPVVSTAFRPVDASELAKNPFRVFVSLLVPQDRRFFDEDIEQRLTRFLDARTIFPDELLNLASRAEDVGLDQTQGERFLDLATEAFALSADPVDRAWYRELELISSVAADIGGVSTTHINHLTPRVMDIDDLYRRMEALGMVMIDDIQGPPAWSGPDVLLRQTSFRALAEPRTFREPDGRIVSGDLRVRFGEVESRGVALTPHGEQEYERAMHRVDSRLAEHPQASRQEVAREVWGEWLPETEAAIARSDLAYFTFALSQRRPDGEPPSQLRSLLDEGWVTAAPIVYEDFLPRSAAGIFSSNLTGGGDAGIGNRGGAERSLDWLAGVVERNVHVPTELYGAQRHGSLNQAAQALGLPAILLPSPTDPTAAPVPRSS